MIILSILLIALLIWLFVKFTWVMLRVGYVLCIGIPLALFLGGIGLALCCTVILIPLGVGIFRILGKIIYPFGCVV